MKLRRIQESYVLTEGKNIDKTWEQYKDKLTNTIGDKQTWIQGILSIDPTYEEGSPNTGDFGIWLTNRWLDGDLTPSSDKASINDLLSNFIKVKPRLEKKDINQYKSIRELFTTVANTPLPRKQERKQLDGAKPVYQDDDWIIYIPETYEASCALGGGSGWCTADTRTRSMYDHYLNEDGGEYYILISKFKPIEKYQFHFESNQFAGAGTNPGQTPNLQYAIDYEDFIKKYPKVGEFFKSINKEPIPSTPLTLQEIIDYITEHCQVIDERLYASIRMDELHDIFKCGDALMLSSMGDFASYYYSDSTLTKLFAESNNAYANKMKQLVQRVVSEPDIDATVEQVLQDENLLLWSFDAYLSDADESDIIIQEILNNANKPYIEYEEYEYVRISCDLNYIANLLYDFADERELLVDVDMDNLIEQALDYYVYYSDSTNDTSILRSLDTNQLLVIGAIARIHDSYERRQEDMVSFMITDLNRFMILPNILNHALSSNIFYSDLLDAVYTDYGKDTNESMRGNTNKMNINEEFTDEVKKLTPGKNGIKILVPEWFYNKVQKKADEYYCTLQWGHHVIDLSDKSNSGGEFYLFGVPIEETDKAIKVDLYYWKQFSRKLEDRSGWKLTIPKSVILNLDDIVSPTLGNTTGSTSSASLGNFKYPYVAIQLEDYENKEINEKASDYGIDLDIGKSRSGDTNEIWSTHDAAFVVQETQKAYKFRFETYKYHDYVNLDIWVPKSAVKSIVYDPTNYNPATANNNNNPQTNTSNSQSSSTAPTTNNSNNDAWDLQTAPQHQVLLTKWYGDKITKEAKDEGFNLFYTKSGLTHYGEAERETAKAVLIKFYARSASDNKHCIWKIWVPKSQITNLDDIIIP